MKIRMFHPQKISEISPRLSSDHNCYTSAFIFKIPRWVGLGVLWKIGSLDRPCTLLPCMRIQIQGAGNNMRTPHKCEPSYAMKQCCTISPPSLWISSLSFCPQCPVFHLLPEEKQSVKSSEVRLEAIMKSKQQ